VGTNRLNTLYFIHPKILTILYLIIAGQINSAELLHGPKGCRIPDLPKAVWGNFLLLTSNGDNILSCGGYPYYKNCYNLDIAGQRWDQHSTLTQERLYTTAVTMPNGVYIFGGNRSPTTSDFLPKNNNGVWWAGPTITNGFKDGCGVKISPEELLLIGGEGTEDRIMSFNTRTNLFSTLGSLQQGRNRHSCTLLNNLILVVGGYSGSSLSSTEIIPLANGTPRYGGSLNSAREHFGLATIGGHYKKVISFGGYDQSSPVQSSVEEWDEDTEEWKLAPYSLEEGKRDFASLAVSPQMVCP